VSYDNQNSNLQLMAKKPKLKSKIEGKAKLLTNVLESLKFETFGNFPIKLLASN